MRRVYLIVIVTLSFFRCSNSHEKKEVVHSGDTSLTAKPANVVKPNVPYTPSSVLTLSRTLLDSLNTLSEEKRFKTIALKCYNFEEQLIKIENISIVSIEKKINLKHYGDIELIEGAIIADDVAEVVNDHFCLVYNPKKQQAICFPLYHKELIKLSSSDSSYYLAGTYIVRGKGYFFVYDYTNGSFNSIFNSGFDDSDNAFFVYKMDYDCIDYKDSILTFQNRKVNKDSLLDLNFSGKVQFFCNKGEEGIDRNDRKAIKEKNINVTYLAYIKNDKVTWALADSIAIPR